MPLVERARVELVLPQVSYATAARVEIFGVVAMSSLHLGPA